MMSEKEDPRCSEKKTKTRIEINRCEKPAPKKFQKTVIQTLLQKENGKLDEVESEEEFEIPHFIGTTLDLSKKRLKEFPNGLLKGAEFVQYLYLEGNKLWALPDTFFQCLCHLKWLDLRNNDLASLPSLGLKNHNALECLLLQGNRIKYLPTELGALPNLKGLQITGNPITNVPYDVIADGFHSIVKHLRKLNCQENILLPNSDAIVVKSSASKDECKSSKMNYSPADDSGEGTITIENDQRQELVDEDLDARCEQSDLIKQFYAPFSSWSEAKKLLMKSKMCPKPKQRIIASCYRPSTRKRSRLGYKRKMITPAMLEEKANKEIQMAKKKETLEKQARKIQRMKDREVLKAWRRQTEMNVEQLKLLDNYQCYPSRNFVTDTPFDVDPEFLSMLNRSDLYRSLKELEAIQRRRRKNVPKLQITIGDLEKQMREIKKKLESFHVYDASGTHVSPRAKQSHLCNKITQMQDIQKTLKNLHQRNLSITGVSANAATDL